MKNQIILRHIHFVEDVSDVNSDIDNLIKNICIINTPCGNR